GFHESNLDPVSAIRQEATDLAFSMHPVTQHEVIDGKRIEFGGAIVEATHYANEQPAVVIEAAPVIDTLMIAKFSSAIIALRLSKRFNDTNVSRRT
ncbi:MAG: hypothetical protein ABIP74_01930, partial [Candidatus Saccharimonas sp.]